MKDQEPSWRGQYTAELCAGSAELSLCLSRHFDSLAFDHSANRHQQRHPCLVVDLTKQEGWEVAKKLRDEGKLVYVHVAPPCGTASRAREKPIPEWLKKSGAPSPQPLRSARHPEGFPWLKGKEAEKVRAANMIYMHAADFLLGCHSRGVGFSVENPTRSFMWKTRWFQKLLQVEGIFEVHFQACMHGGRRPKHSSWWTNVEELKDLAVLCDGKHQHQQWGLSKCEGSWHFKTAEEAAYPRLLCERVTAAVVKRVERIGKVTKRVPVQETDTNKQRSAGLAAAAGKQPRGNKLPQVVPEFSEVRVLGLPLQDWLPLNLKTGSAISAPKMKELGYGTGDRPGKVVRVDMSEGCIVRVDGAYVEEVTVRIGLHWTFDEFVEQSREVLHPFDSSQYLEDDILSAAFRLLTKGPEEVQREAEAVLLGYKVLAKELEEKDDEAKAAMQPERARVIRRKRIRLFKEMLKKAGIKDKRLVEDLVQGIELIGNAEFSAQFPPKSKPARFTRTQVQKASKWTRRVSMAKETYRSEKDREMAKQVWDATMEERGEGWVSGPYTEEELLRILGPLFVASKRFGIDQGGKIRVIDDLSASLVNPAFGCEETVSLGGIDELAALARTMLQMVSDEGWVEVTLSNGTVLSGKLHDSLTVEEARQLAGRTLDLKSAYKQLLIHRTSEWAAVVAVTDPEDMAKKLFRLNALPFGASAAVLGFNRFARAMRKIGTRLFGLVWTNFFDDYPQLALEKQGDGPWRVAEGSLELLGWTVSSTEAKAKRFDKEFDALGVRVDLSDSAQGVVRIKNKESRVSTVCEQLQEIEDTEVCTCALASSMRGRLQFAESSMFVRLTAIMMPLFQARASGKNGGSEVCAQMKLELQWAKWFLREGGPRELQARDVRPPLLIYTDGALEGADDEIGTVGALMIDGEEAEYFGARVPPELMEGLQAASKKIIACLEILPVALSLDLWDSRILHRRVFVFVDNDAARGSLVKMQTNVPPMKIALDRVARKLVQTPFRPWYARVASECNPGDSPSRLEGSKLRSIKAEEVHADMSWLHESLRGQRKDRKSQRGLRTGQRE